MTTVRIKNVSPGAPDMLFNFHQVTQDGLVYSILDNDEFRLIRSTNYNLNFNKLNGYMERWGKSKEDDPNFSPLGPEILDLEISVNGCPPFPNSGNCKFCYKNNTLRPPTNMSFETFKLIIDKFPKTLTQIAFGITGIQTNPDFIRMMEYCRKIGVIPNFTLTGVDLTDELADKVSNLVGALAVSCYPKDKDICYNTVKKFTDHGIDQTNIHLMVSKETLEFVYEVLEDRLTDPWLSKMNCIVFLGVKPKGRARDRYQPLSKKEYSDLVTHCLTRNIPIGFDSCSAPKFEAAVRSSELPKEMQQRLIQASESCESFGLFSSYINVEGDYFPCSFTENEVNCSENGCGDWSTGLSVVDCEDFVRDIWNHPKVVKNRKTSIKTSEDGCRKCLTFPEINK